MYLLFKVEKSSVASVLFDGSYRVRRICSDAAVIESFTAQATVCVDEQVGSTLSYLAFLTWLLHLAVGLDGLFLKILFVSTFKGCTGPI